MRQQSGRNPGDGDVQLNLTFGFQLQDMQKSLHLFDTEYPLWETVKVLVTQLYLIFCDSMDCSPPGSSVHGILQARILEWVAILFSRDILHPGIEPRSPVLQVDSLPAEPQKKPENTGVGSLSLFQGIFLTQGLNQGLLHCRWIQLSHKESP